VVSSWGDEGPALKGAFWPQWHSLSKGPSVTLCSPNEDFGRPNHTHIRHARILWTVPYTRHDVFVNILHTHQACIDLLNIVHPSSMHASCEHHTHIKHACILWTSYTLQTCMYLVNGPPYTRHDAFVNITHTSSMHASCEHRKHIRPLWRTKKLHFRPSDEMSMKNVDKDAVNTKECFFVI
jgi:hypothetical protein